MDMYEVVLSCSLALWLILSILAQVRTSRIQALRRFDVLSLVPQYNFFAPTPGTKDFHLLYRLKVEGEGAGPWRELTRERRRGWTQIIWNPERRENKALFDIATVLAREYQQCSQTAIQISVPYLVLLNHLAQKLPGSAELRAQFMVMTSHGVLSRKEPQLLFISSTHKL